METLSVLDKIHELIKFTPKDDLVRYQIANFFNRDDRKKEMNPVKEDEILHDIQRWGALKIYDKERIDNEFIYYLQILLKFEEIYLDHKNLFNKNKISSKINLELLPGVKNWEDIEIKFKNEFDIDVYINGKFYRKLNNEELGFFKSGTKDKKPDIHWAFLYQLSIIYNNIKIAQPTIEIMAKCLKTTKEACEKAKSQLSKKLQEIFNITEKPFYDYKEKGYYQTKFILKTLPELRGDGEVFISKGDGYNDNIKYEDPEGTNL